MRLDDDIERTVEIDEQSRRASRRRVQQLGVQPTVQRPLVRRHETLLEQASREDLGVLVPGAIEDPASAESAHASHTGETRGEKVELEMQSVRAHLVRPAVETLEPRVVGIDALEGDLQAEARRERVRQRRLARANHSSDADQHGSQSTKNVRRRETVTVT